jgi:hypothetical protein
VVRPDCPTRGNEPAPYRRDESLRRVARLSFPPIEILRRAASKSTAYETRILLRPLLEFVVSWLLVPCPRKHVPAIRGQEIATSNQVRSAVPNMGSKRHEDNSRISRFFRRHFKGS